MSIRDFLQGRHVWFETLLHAPASSATKLAQAIHVPGRFVAKGVLVNVESSFLLAVLPATSRIDLVRLSQLLQGREVRIATEDQVESIFGDCERGACPPFGRLYGLRTLVDASLSGGSEIVFVGNTRHEGLRMRYRDYEALEEPIRARFALVCTPRQRRQPRRNAG
jgi:Ala-tRNA(Pro) deacylase